MAFSRFALQHPAARSGGLRATVSRFGGMAVMCAVAVAAWGGTAWAGDELSIQPRLVPGGVDLFQGDKRVEVLSLRGLSLGTVSPVAAATSLTPPGTVLPHTSMGAGSFTDKLALGGYVAYNIDSYGISSAVRNHDGASAADVSASYAGTVLGLQGTTALTVGYDWLRPSNFSVNARTAGIDSLDYSHSGVSLSLSWNHSITPSLYLGGYASALKTSPQADDLTQPPANAFRLGAGMGLKF